MVFRCFLDRSAFSAPPPGSLGAPDDLGDYQVSVMNACELLADTGLRFAVSGFGLDDWRLDIQYDLSVFMEELPEMLRAATRGEQYEFYFYSQGVERNLIYSPAGDIVQIRCVSITSWVPDPDVEVIPLASLIEMIREMAIEFSRALRAAGGPISEAEPFRSWAAGMVVPEP